MMLHQVKIGFILLFVAFAGKLFSQNNEASHQIVIEVKEIAVLALSSNNPNNVTFQPFTNQEAGSSLIFKGEQTNNSIWLNYSSIKQSEMHRRTVTAYIQGEVPDGLNLIVTAMPAQGSGNGKLGESVGTTLLGDQPTEVITDIGSCYTGKGASNGHNLVYNLEVDESLLTYSNLKQEDLTFNVVYTLSD